MIGMNFGSFIILLIISIIVSSVLHFVFKFYVRKGLSSFIAKVILGWIGAWLGSPVFGHWFGGLKCCEVYIIPAILGSLAFLIVLVDFVKSTK